MQPTDSERAANVHELVAAKSDEQLLDLVHGALDRLWSRLQPPADESSRMFFTMAVAEVAANILEHARPANRAHEIQLSLTAGSVELVARLYDNGLPLDRAIGTDAPAEDLAVRGRGLAVTLIAVEELSYERIDDWNHWRLVKRLENAEK